MINFGEKKNYTEQEENKIAIKLFGVPYDKLNCFRKAKVRGEMLKRKK
jgi:hypothetical protein